MKRLLIAACLVSSVLAIPASCSALDAKVLPSPSPAPTAPEVPTGGDPKPKMTDVTLGLSYGGPTRLTGSATVMRGHPKMLVAFSPGRLVQVRVGARGGQLGVGLVAGAFEESLFRPSGLAVTLKAVAIRTWRDPTGETNGHSYAGLESDVVLLGIRGSMGYAWKVGGKGGPGGRLVWSVGLGL